jgi:hypothetical protein
MQQKIPSKNCVQACDGNPKQNCGGGHAIFVFKATCVPSNATNTTAASA